MPARKRIVKENVNFGKDCKGKCKFSSFIRQVRNMLASKTILFASAEMLRPEFVCLMYLPPECLGRVHTLLWQPLQTVADEVDGRADYTNKDLEGREGR